MAKYELKTKETEVGVDDFLDAVPDEGRREDAKKVRAMMERIGNEVETLYTNGPAGGGGVTKSAREVVGILSTYVPRGVVSPAVHYVAA